MFAYLIIGSELVVLYIVFWIVFIREPKQCEIRAELWGHYEDAPIRAKTPVTSSALNILNNSKKITWSLPSRLHIKFKRAAKLRHLRHRRHHLVVPVRYKVHAKDYQSVPNKIEIGQDINRLVAEKFLLVLNRTLNKFSAKIPY